MLLKLLAVGMPHIACPPHPPSQCSHVSDRYRDGVSWVHGHSVVSGGELAYDESRVKQVLCSLNRLCLWTFSQYSTSIFRWRCAGLVVRKTSAKQFCDFMANIFTLQQVILIRKTALQTCNVSLML